MLDDPFSGGIASTLRVRSTTGYGCSIPKDAFFTAVASA
jgi:hypothetical protein